LSVRLVILGLLRQESLHGYELKHVIEEHMGDWTKIPVGSIYFALGKLADEGKIREVAVEREGKRPEKTVYEITAAGDEEFFALLRDCLGTSEKEYHEIDQALAFLDALKPREAAALFGSRVSLLEAQVLRLKKHKAERTRLASVPPSAKAIFSHSQRRLEAELAWSREVLADIEAGRLSKRGT
jgi:DNA-binding PadR family transcriptional regulator